MKNYEKVKKQWSAALVIFEGSSRSFENCRMKQTPEGRLNQKELEKLAADAQIKYQQLYQASQLYYHTTVETNRLKNEHFHSELPLILNSIQTEDEKRRISFEKFVFDRFTSTYESTILPASESFASIKSIVHRIDPAFDSQLFIAMHKVFEPVPGDFICEAKLGQPHQGEKGPPVQPKVPAALPQNVLPLRQQIVSSPLSPQIDIQDNSRSQQQKMELSPVSSPLNLQQNALTPQQQKMSTFGNPTIPRQTSTNLEQSKQLELTLYQLEQEKIVLRSTEQELEAVDQKINVVMTKQAALVVDLAPKGNKITNLPSPPLPALKPNLTALFAGDRPPTLGRKPTLSADFTNAPAPLAKRASVLAPLAKQASVLAQQDTPTSNESVPKAALAAAVPMPVAKKNVAKALYNFSANEGTDELTITVGMEVEVLERDGEWWKVREVNSPRQGFVPGSYVEENYI